VGDSRYSRPEYLHAIRHHHNLVTLARVRTTRTFYRQPSISGEEATSTRRGNPTWYGEPFRLRDSTTWHVPDETVALMQVSHRGKRYRVEIQVWRQMLMRGKQKPQPLLIDSVPSCVGATFPLPHATTYRIRRIPSAQHVVGESCVSSSPTDFATESKVCSWSSMGLQSTRSDFRLQRITEIRDAVCEQRAEFAPRIDRTKRCPPKNG
jgi:hypothetical protein